MTDAHTFLDQNNLAAQTLTLDDVDGLAEHHAGGLFVLFGETFDEDGWVKVHDSWGDEGTVVVHTYSKDDSADVDRVEHYGTGREALERMEEILAGRVRVVGRAGTVSLTPLAATIARQALEVGIEGADAPDHVVDEVSRLLEVLSGIAS